MIKKAIGLILTAASLFSFHCSYAKEKNFIESEKKEISSQLLSIIHFPHEGYDFYIGGIAQNPYTKMIFATADIYSEKSKEKIWFSAVRENTMTEARVILPQSDVLLSHLTLYQERLFFFSCAQKNNTRGTVLGYIQSASGFFKRMFDIPLPNDPSVCNGLVIKEKKIFASSGETTNAADDIISVSDEIKEPYKKESFNTFITYQDIFGDSYKKENAILNITEKKDDPNAILALIKREKNYELYSFNTHDASTKFTYQINTKNIKGEPSKITHYTNDWYFIMTNQGVWIEKINSHSEDPILVTTELKSYPYNRVDSMITGKDRLSVTKEPVLFVSLTLSLDGKIYEPEIHEYLVSTKQKK